MVARTFVEPIFNTGQLIGLALTVVAMMILIRVGTVEDVAAELQDWFIAIEAFLYVVIAWAFICLIISPLRVIRDERQRGVWFENSFSYHKPVLVKTMRLEAGKNNYMERIYFPDAEPGGFAYCKFSLSPDIGRQFKIGFYDIKVDGGGWLGVRLDDKRSFCFEISVLPEASASTLRIYCTEFYLGSEEASAARRNKEISEATSRHDRP